MNTDLPKLIGYTFNDPTRKNFHVSHKLDFKKGVPILKFDHFDPENKDAFSVRYIENFNTDCFDPKLIYGRCQNIAPPPFIPHYALYDKKCLNFKAFFKQSVANSPLENYRIRHVNIVYFLEDDTLTVMEPTIDNSGLMQGRLVKRSKIPKNKRGDFLHWKDLNVGIDIPIYGIVYHTVSCDSFTKEYMRCQGIELNLEEDLPTDSFIQTKQMLIAPKQRVTPKIDDKLRRYLEFEGKILKFDGIWDDRKSELGEMREVIIYYYLADDTIAVAEVHHVNDGRDPFPLLLKKTKLPKNWKDRPPTFPSCVLELSDNEVNEYYQPIDLIVGETIYVFGRKILLIDCNDFTRRYYSRLLNIIQPDRLSIEITPPPKIYPKQIPPHVLGIGSLEDSIQNCFTVLPKRPKKDEIKQLINMGKYLRYTAELISAHPEDKFRKFIITYSLANSTIQIDEPPIKNSGIKGGRFLKPQLVCKPDTDPNDPEYYTPDDFYIGAVVNIFKHYFRITGTDLYVYRYIENNQNKFPQNVVDNIRNYIHEKVLNKSEIENSPEKFNKKEKENEFNIIEKKLEKAKNEYEKCLERIKVRDLDEKVSQEKNTNN